MKTQRRCGGRFLGALYKGKKNKVRVEAAKSEGMEEMCQKEVTSDNLNFLRELGSQVIFCRQEVGTEKGLDESSGCLVQRLRP